MIKFHPTPEHLQQFVKGTLSPVESLMISAHCDMCARCQSRVEMMTADYANTEIEQAVQSYDPDFDAMLASITQQPAAERASQIKARRNSTAIELDGKTFELPKTLHRLVKKKGNWSSLVGKLWQAPVDLGIDGVANFIYIEKGGTVPEHTHRGSEMTLVINGEFSDGLNDYDSGDLIYMTGDHTHAPRSDAPEGCLVFSIVDQPLHFTSGLARLLNPFSHLFFR
ncbi:anti-sigma factor [Aestuariibacter sp. GS-14]|jgi:putative transcriptional regulator|uniref:ChrR family anti-sigma-E factor n=1 Tax=Aestuariibacter sp. GS-14 TaxID=2590670 RepID=UPI001129538E|nr:ChrR family anti-sigma-E factor [Aestuariibacter sp. GS-14]TPV53707.1 anti-sigma factor [Aestuariibacter sp. GS-14]